jgi:lambda family phage portal protein
MGIVRTVMDVFRIGGNPNPSYEAAGTGRRLRGFNPPKRHVNAAIIAAGPTLIARSRWLYNNDGYVGNAIDEWVSAATGDGIKPRPKIKDKAVKKALLELFWRWTEEADADGMTDYYGLQEKVAREVRLAGECFVRIRARRPDDLWTVPFQLQLLTAEMLDLAFNQTEPSGNYVRAGIEFDKIGRRVAYHFWRFHPYDDVPRTAGQTRDRVRVPAAEVIHVIEGKEGGQIRGVPSVARILVKIFKMEAYDDAELERKGTAALFTGFIVGRGDNPISVDDDDDEFEDTPIAPMQPGAMIDLGDDKDIKFASPADVGGSYEPFQYRNILKISAGLGVPYAYVSGDMTKGNFSNVRTDIIRFRRRVSQWQNNTLIFQLCRVVWMQFVERAYMAGLIELPGYDEDPTPYWAAEHLPPRQEWIDPAKDVSAEKEAIKAGLMSRTQAVAARGYDIEDLDDEIREERKSADDLKFDTDGSEPEPVPGAPFGNKNAAPEEPDQDQPKKETEADEDA